MPLLNEKMSNGVEKKVDPIIWLSAIGVVLLAVFLFVFIQFQQSPELFKEATVAIDYGNGKVRVFKGPVGESARVWDAFQQAIVTGGIDIEISDHFVPQTIDGLKNGAGGKHWNLYVNNVRQKFTPFEIQAKPGDEIAFRFE